MGSLKEKAKALLQQCEVVTLTSINKEGYPRPVPLSKIKTEGLTT
ncbi:pyridoxamine 5'-phosphate oxidase family protein, partial [Phocaeicola vulgatus]